VLEVKVVEVEGLADSSAEVVYDSSEDANGSGPSVQTHSLRRLRRPATGVSGTVSLSDSDEESRLSPVWGDLTLSLVRLSLWGIRWAGGGRAGNGSDEDVEGKLALESVNNDSEVDKVVDGSLESEVEVVDSEEVDSEGSVVDSEGSEETESAVREMVDEDSDSMSEWARVNLVVWISSTRGVLNETFFSAGNLGLPDILRASVRSIGLFASIECKLCEIEYGMVAELEVEAEDIEDELGVLESCASGDVESWGT
jgi:hypothetical protein